MTFDQTVYNAVDLSLCLPILQSFRIQLLVYAPDFSRCIGQRIANFCMAVVLRAVLLGQGSMLAGRRPCTKSSSRLSRLLISVKRLEDIG